MTNFYFKIKNKINYTERTVCIVETTLNNAKIELRRCYPNWIELSYRFRTSISEPATEKQLNYISFIEEETGIQFTGQTKQEASQYIQENKEKVSVTSKENTWSIINGY